MTTIVKATENDAYLLSEIAKLTFIESHGSSASAGDIALYISEKYSQGIFENELRKNKNNYYLIYHNNSIAGYSNIVLNSPYTSETENVAKLDRIYLLKEFYDLKLGQEFFMFNVNLAKENHQKGMWLFVWEGNSRAVNFYKKNGFITIGSHDFKISETHSNPNHQMLLTF